MRLSKDSESFPHCPVFDFLFDFRTFCKVGNFTGEESEAEKTRLGEVGPELIMGQKLFHFGGFFYLFV